MTDHSDLHVLVISTWYPQGKDALIGIYHKQFCESLAQNGIKVNMLHVDRQAISLIGRYPFMKKEYSRQENGYTTYFQRMLNLSRVSFDLQMRNYVKALEKLYRRYEKLHGKPHILHAQVTTPAGYAACVLGKKIGVPVVITEHASYFERFFSGQEGKYGRFAASAAARITCVSGYMKDIYAEKHGISAQVLPNIVDCSAFAGPKQPGDGVLRFTTVSALRPQKQIDLAARALKLLRDTNALPPFRYTVVGDGDQKQRYMQAVEEMGMQDCVEFVGRKSREEIARILSSTDILLIASTVETFGIPAVEALAAGVPVVSTKCRGPEGFLTADCSELCDPEDAESMAQAILRMYERLGELDEGGIRAVATQFDGPSVAAQAAAIYRQVLSGEK